MWPLLTGNFVNNNPWLFLKEWPLHTGRPLFGGGQLHRFDCISKYSITCFERITIETHIYRNRLYRNPAYIEVKIKSRFLSFLLHIKKTARISNSWFSIFLYIEVDFRSKPNIFNYKVTIYVEPIMSPTYKRNVRTFSANKHLHLKIEM